MGGALFAFCFPTCVGLSSGVPRNLCAVSVEMAFGFIPTCVGLLTF